MGLPLFLKRVLLCARYVLPLLLISISAVYAQAKRSPATAYSAFVQQQTTERFPGLQPDEKSAQQEHVSPFLHDLQLKKREQWLYGSFAVIFVLLILALLFASVIYRKRQANLILKETNDFFEEQNAQLEASNHFKEQLISLMAHDIRGPIASLQNILSLFDNRLLNPQEVQRLMAASYHDLSNLIRILNDLLLWIGLQLDYTKLEKSKFHISDMLQPIVHLYQQQAQDKNITLRVEQAVEKELYADKEAVATVIRNLVGNSIKFSKPNDCIDIRVLPVKNNVVRIEIRDTGIGMSEELVKNLFTNPVYARRYGTLNEEGSGLGIQICLHYLQLNNSELFVESSPGKGTTFWFDLTIE